VLGIFNLVTSRICLLIRLVTNKVVLAGKCGSRALTGLIESKRAIQEDNGKRSWTGCQPRVEIHGTAMKFWKFVKSVIGWYRQRQSDTARTSDRLGQATAVSVSNQSPQANSAVHFLKSWPRLRKWIIEFARGGDLAAARAHFQLESRDHSCDGLW